MSAHLTKACCTYHPDAPLLDDYHAGDVVCSACGLVVGDRVIDVGSEWRSFNDDSGSKDNSRVGRAENELYGNDLSTCIQPAKGSGSVFNRRNTSGLERGLENAYKEISDIAGRLNLPKTIEDNAKYTYKQFYEAKIARKKGFEILSAACIFLACRKANIPRTTKEICGVSSVSKKDLHRGYQVLMKGLQTSVDVVSSGDFMSRFCSFLGLPKNIEMAAKHISSKLKSINELVSRSPITLAAASIYMSVLAGGITKPIADIAAATGVAEATIKTSYKIMLPYARNLFPEDFTFVVPVSQLPRS